MEEKTETEVEEIGKAGPKDNPTFYGYLKSSSLFDDKDEDKLNHKCPECGQEHTVLYKTRQDPEGKMVFTYNAIRLCTNPECSLKKDLGWLILNSHWRQKPEEYVYPEIVKKKAVIFNDPFPKKTRNKYNIWKDGESKY